MRDNILYNKKWIWPTGAQSCKSRPVPILDEIPTASEELDLNKTIHRYKNKKKLASSL